VAVERFNPREAVILGKNIAQMRRERDLSQDELAEKIDVGPRYVQKLERGLHTPSLGLLIRLRKVLRAEWADLLKGL
jgi:transcriptional regulator with XRE-family HTH domain